jgi:hypothetical protein
MKIWRGMKEREKMQRTKCEARRRKQEIFLFVGTREEEGEGRGVMTGRSMENYKKILAQSGHRFWPTRELWPSGTFANAERLARPIHWGLFYSLRFCCFVMIVKTITQLRGVREVGYAAEASSRRYGRAMMMEAANGQAVTSGYSHPYSHPSCT